MNTERLILREQSIELLSELITKPLEEQMIFLGFEEMSGFEFEINRIHTRLKNNIKDWRKWDLIEKDSRVVIGSCSLHNWVKEHERAEIGYLLHKKFRGKGYMIEALQAINEIGFTKMDLNRIEALISPQNLPSQNLIKKLGFTFEGTLREHYKSNGKIHDSMVFSLLKSEFNTDSPNH